MTGSGSQAPLLASIPYYSFPEIVLGPLRLHTFGLFVMAGVVIGIVVASRRNERFGIPRSETEKVGIILVVSGLVGARIAWAITHREEVQSPLDVIAVWNGGLQFSGGFIVAVALAPFVTRSWPRPQRWALLDGAVLGLAIGQCIGRLGCVAVGEHLGGETGFFLGMNYLGGTVVEGPLVVGATYHNCALYEFLWLIPVIGVLVWLDRRGARPGIMSGFFLVAYGVLRFITDAARINDERVLGLTGAQFMCLALVPLGLWVLWSAVRPREDLDHEPVDTASAAAVDVEAAATTSAQEQITAGPLPLDDDPA